MSYSRNWKSRNGFLLTWPQFRSNPRGESRLPRLEFKPHGFRERRSAAVQLHESACRRLLTPGKEAAIISFAFKTEAGFSPAATVSALRKEVRYITKRNSTTISLSVQGALTGYRVCAATSESTLWRRSAARSTGILPVANHGQDGRATVITQTLWAGRAMPTCRSALLGTVVCWFAT